MSLSTTSRLPNIAAARLTSGHNGRNGAITALEDAIAKFQAQLDDADRIKLQGLKKEPHDTQSIIKFTADLDHLDKGRRGKSIASRLAAFLQIIDQYSPIVDTYISSNPEIAALIWGSVKLTFLLLANFTSYFQSFVELLNGFGSLSERFAEYQLILSNSPRLKDSICNFHSAVITCCERIVVIVRRPLKTKAWKSLFKSFQTEIEAYVDDIKEKANEVRDDIRLAKLQFDNHEKQLHAKEREKAASSRTQIADWIHKSKSELRYVREKDGKRVGDKRWQSMLAALSSYDHTAAFIKARNKRHLGTVEWIFDSQEFQDWYGNHDSTVLSITGKIGSGKTILASHVITSLISNRKTGQFTSFFFSRFDDASSLTSDTIIRSLVAQLLSSCPKNGIEPALAAELSNCLENAKDNYFPTQELAEIALKGSGLVRDWFIVVDGIDECTTQEQNTVYQFLSQLLRDINQDQNNSQGAEDNVERVVFEIGSTGIPETAKLHVIVTQIWPDHKAMHIPGTQRASVHNFTANFSSNSKFKIEAKAQSLDGDVVELGQWTYSLDEISNREPWAIRVPGGTLTVKTTILQSLSKPEFNSNRKGRVKIIFSGRETTRKPILKSFPSMFSLFTGSNHTSEDIMIYARDIIKNKQFNEELVVEDPQLIEEILDAIRLKADGMFLWVFLTIQDLCSQKSDKDIREALDSIPPDLPTTFNRALSRIVRHRHQDIATDIFKWTAVVVQPLTLAQLREALSINVGHTRLEPDNLINGIERAGFWCQNLIHIEEFDNTVHFSHLSVREFLLTPDSGNFGNFHFDLGRSDSDVAEACITYINWDEFSTALVPTDDPNNSPASSFGIPVGRMAERALQSSFKGTTGARIGQFASRVLASRSRSNSTNPNSEVRPMYIPPNIHNGASGRIEYHFWDYASQNWYLHCIKKSQDEAQQTWKLLGRILIAPHHALKLPWMDASFRHRELVENDWFDSLVPLLDLTEKANDSKSTFLSAIISGVYFANTSLVCCAYIQLVENSENFLLIKAVFRRLVMGAYHTCFDNECINSLCHTHHDLLIEAVTECIANDIESWPAWLNPGYACVCKERNFGIHADIWEVICKGYNRGQGHDFPYLTAFARVALRPTDQFAMEVVCDTLNISPIDLLSAKTITGKSILDVAADYSIKGNSAFTSILNYTMNMQENDQLDRRQWGMLITNALRSSTRRRAMANISLLSEALAQSPFRDQSQFKTVYKDVSLNMHGSWSPDVISELLKGLYWINPAEFTEDLSMSLFKGALLERNWCFADGIVNHFTFNAAKGHGDQLDLLTSAFSCKSCRLVLSGNDMEGGYKLCTLHREQGRRLIIQSRFAEETAEENDKVFTPIIATLLST